jgi:hypothetical protein
MIKLTDPAWLFFEDPTNMAKSGLEPARLVSKSSAYAVAAQAMRRILVEQRRRNAVKRMPALRRESGLVLQPHIDMLALDDALNRLAVNDPEKARIVELRYLPV